MHVRAFAALVAEAANAALVASQTPPRRFAAASFATYRPDPAYPSQGKALARLVRSRRPWEKRALYLNGPFGVGKTHLLAAAYHAAPEPKAFFTFPDLVLTLIQLGVDEAVKQLRAPRLHCVDEL